MFLLSSYYLCLIIDREFFSELESRQSTVKLRLNSLQASAKMVMDVISLEAVAQSLKQDKTQNLTFLQENYGVSCY
jgi:hypothetical protein